jgi:hypothetical protein
MPMTLTAGLHCGKRTTSWQMQGLRALRDRTTRRVRHVGANVGQKEAATTVSSSGDDAASEERAVCVVERWLLSRGAGMERVC